MPRFRASRRPASGDRRSRWPDVRRWGTALAAGALVAALPAMAQAAFAWNLDVSPTTAMQGQSTQFSLTATNEDTQSQLGCLEVDLPASFVILSVGTPSASNGSVWASNISGNSVVVNSTTGPGRLQSGETVAFSITARPTAAGTFAWNNHAHASSNCSGTDLTGAPKSITVTPAPTPNPTPSPTPPPTPNPTPAPPPPSTTPRPTSGASSTPAPTRTPEPSADSSKSAAPDVSFTPRPGEPSSTPAASSSASPSSAGPPPSAGSGSGGPDVLRVAPLGDAAGGAADDLGAGVDVLALLDGPFMWFVPSAAVGAPGLLVVIFVTLQAIGALAWIPAVRRMGGEDRQRRTNRSV
jgi:hypothetical protein